MNNLKLEKIINKYLNINNYKDNIYNGLQIEGKKKIKKIITGVTINLPLIKKAIKNNADAIIVHHGLFWKKKLSNINGILKKKIKNILINDINLYSWHLPLDFHPKIGNNIIIANLLNLKIKIYSDNKYPILIGNKKSNFIKKINKIFKSKFYFHKSKNKKIKIIGICSGSGQKYIEYSIYKYNIDTYITGEISDITFDIIKEYDINYFSIGHYSSEIEGIKKLGIWIQKQYNIDTKFININNPF